MKSVEAVQPVHRAHPKKALSVFDDGRDVVVAEALIGSVVQERIRWLRQKPTIGEQQKQKDGLSSVWHGAKLRFLLTVWKAWGKFLITNNPCSKNDGSRSIKTVQCYQCITFDFMPNDAKVSLNDKYLRLLGQPDFGHCNDAGTNACFLPRGLGLFLEGSDLGVIFTGVM